MRRCPCREADLAMMRRLGASEDSILVAQTNLANLHANRWDGLNRPQTCDEMYTLDGLRLDGEEHEDTLNSANNYASLLGQLNHFKEAKSLLRKTVPVARRVLGESHDLTLRVRFTYALALYHDDDATLDDQRDRGDA